MVQQQIIGQVEICIFKIPPCHDIIVIGKKAPIGKHAVEIMLETIAPGMFQAVPIQHSKIEALVVRNSHLNLFGKEQIVDLIISEIESQMDDTAVLNIGLNARLTKNVTFNTNKDDNK